ncbi:DUF2934 domain-containing protein [Methylomonas sp. AM2-LC]|uniref:DUF2934 domain-containing protein n=1 Tax=Methylomonas sp. AM2-LC TaxID=3153301 RepID=UPI0032630693
MKARSESRLREAAYRELWVSEAAYFLAEHRQFIPGRALDDWLQAEKEFCKMLIQRYLQLAYEDGGVSVIGLQRLATAVGVVNSSGLTQVLDLIHAIQVASKNEPCFYTECNQSETCLWKTECKKLIAKWHPQQ